MSEPSAIFWEREMIVIVSLKDINDQKGQWDRKLYRLGILIT